MTRFALKFPYFVIVVCLMTIVVGVTSVVRMPVDLFPPINIPVVVVATFFAGMPPEQIENDISGRFERFFTLGSGIDHIESRSLPGVSLIKVYFQPGFNADTAVSQIANLAAANRPWYERLFDVDDNFTRGDKRLLYGTLVWNVFWQIVAVSILLWTIFRGRLSANWWFNYSIVVNVCIAIVLAVVTTIWFAFGVTRDLRRLFVSLGEVHRNDADDGTVRNHHNLGEDPAATAPPEKRV